MKISFSEVMMGIRCIAMIAIFAPLTLLAQVKGSINGTVVDSSQLRYLAQLLCFPIKIPVKSGRQPARSRVTSISWIWQEAIIPRGEG